MGAARAAAEALGEYFALLLSPIPKNGRCRTGSAGREPISGNKRTGWACGSAVVLGYLQRLRPMCLVVRRARL
jgi:hypothetical protein